MLLAPDFQPVNEHPKNGPTRAVKYKASLNELLLCRFIAIYVRDGKDLLDCAARWNMLGRRFAAGFLGRPVQVSAGEYEDGRRADVTGAEIACGMLRRLTVAVRQRSEGC